jgi:hypothetical protein
LCGALLLGVVSASLFFLYTSAPGKPLVWQISLIGVTWLAAALGIFQFLHQLPVGELEFDGVHWYFFDKAGHEKVHNERVDNERVGSVRVRFDGQNCFLLRFEDDLNKVNWLWLEAGSSAHPDPSDWLDVRRAVYSRANVQNLPNFI